MQALLFTPQTEEASVLVFILQQAGFSVRSVRDLESAIQSWPERPADLVLISLSGPVEKAYRQIEEMRLYAAMPICVVSDPLPEDQQVRLLEAGCDLLVQRPYGIRYFMAQIKALLRRSAGLPFFSLPILTQREVSLDPSNRTVSIAGGEARRLTQLEFRLLYTLMVHAGQIIPAEQIVEHVWGYSGEGNRELVRGLVQRLRSKVEPNPKAPQYILTEPGIGYYFKRPLGVSGGGR